MAENHLTIRIDGDASGLKKELNKVTGEAGKAAKEVNSAGKSGAVAVDQSAKSAGVSIGQLAGKLKALAVVAGLVQVGKKIIDIGKAAQQAYADFEQLSGGIETLYGPKGTKSITEYAALTGKKVTEVTTEYNHLLRGQQMMFKQSETAFKRAGMSANEYMETATAFAGSLVTSLGGDTVEAARIADMAIVDMSDNANKMGSDIASIQNAYQGFAKQNYTLLDNLKLGYGGTKEEMERLLADAEKISGIHYDISNLADVYNAIHEIQNQLAITGTTAKEASDTISGSANQLKAAWNDALAEMGKEDADMGRVGQNLVGSVATYIENAGPTWRNYFENAVSLFSDIDWSPLTEGIDKAFGTNITEAVANFKEEIKSATDELSTQLGRVEGDMDVLFKALGNLYERSGLKSMVDSYLEGLKSGWGLIKGAVGNAVEAVTEVVSDTVDVVVDTAVTAWDNTVTAAEAYNEESETIKNTPQESNGRDQTYWDAYTQKALEEQRQLEAQRQKDAEKQLALTELMIDRDMEMTRQLVEITDAVNDGAEALGSGISTHQSAMESGFGEVTGKVTGGQTDDTAVRLAVNEAAHQFMSVNADGTVNYDWTGLKGMYEGFGLAHLTPEQALDYIFGTNANANGPANGGPDYYNAELQAQQKEWYDTERALAQQQEREEQLARIQAYNGAQTAPNPATGTTGTLNPMTGEMGLFEGIDALLQAVPQEVIDSWNALKEAVTGVMLAFNGQIGGEETGAGDPMAAGASPMGMGMGDGSGGMMGIGAIMESIQPFDPATIVSWQDMGMAVAQIADAMMKIYAVMGGGGDDSAEGLLANFQALAEYFDDEFAKSAQNLVLVLASGKKEETLLGVLDHMATSLGNATEFMRLLIQNFNQFMDMKDKIVETLSSIAGMAADMAGSLSEAAAAAERLLAALQALNSMGDSSIPTVGTGGGSGGGTINKDSTPSGANFATGGLTPAGLGFTVGERGPEIMSTSRTMNVFTHKTLMGQINDASHKLSRISAAADTVKSLGGNTFNTDSSTNFNPTFGNIYGESYLRDMMADVFMAEMRKEMFLAG